MTSRTYTSDTGAYRRPMMIALVVGVLAAIAAVAGLFIAGPKDFFPAYLFSFLFVLALCLGSLCFLLIHFVMGTRWGLTIRRVAGAAAGTIPLVALLFIPILVGMRYLYPWTDPAVVGASELIQHKTWWLNTPFFIVRAVIYFIAWFLLARAALRMSDTLAQALPDDLPLRERMTRLGAIGLIVYLLTMTFAAIDWSMTLEPAWTSSIYGLVIILAQLMVGLSFGVLMLNLLPDYALGRRWTSTSTPLPFRDLGTLLFVFIVGWAYLAYFQFLIIWAGNIPREVVWYTSRINGGWLVVILIITVLQFVLPFLLLLTARIRHNLRLLAPIAAMLLFTNLLVFFWHVAPAFSPDALRVTWLDIVLPIAMTALWLAGFFFMLARRPALTAGEKIAMRMEDTRRETAVP